MIVFNISGSHPWFHQDGRVRWQWGPVPWRERKPDRNLFTSVEQIRNDFARVKHRISLGPVPEENPLEQDDLNDGAGDKRHVDTNVQSNLPTGDGGWQDKPGENDP
jgi:hypothetical protein